MTSKSTPPELPGIDALQAELRSLELVSRRQYDMLEALFAQSPAAISVQRLDDGAIIDVNARWQQLTGYTWEEATRSTSVSLGFWPDIEARNAALREMQANPMAGGVEISFLTRNGEELLLEWRGSIMHIAGEPHVLVYLSDITAQRIAQEAVAESEQALQDANDELRGQLELFEETESLAQAGHWIVPQGQTVPRWSRGLFRLTQTPWTEKLTLDKSRVGIHPEDKEVYLAAREAMDGRLLEFRWIRRDGDVRWVRSRMHRYHRQDDSYVDFGVVQDFTEEAEAKLVPQRRLDVIQRLTSRLPEMVFQFEMFSRDSGRFLFVSDACTAIFGVTPEEARAAPENVFRLIHPDDIVQTLKSMNAAAVDGMTWAQEFRIIGKDGHVRTLFGKAITYRETDGKYNAYGSVTDITEHKASLAILQESEARFRALTELSSDWYWEQDAEYRFTRFHGAIQAGRNKTGQHSIGKTRWENGALNMTEAAWAAHRAVLDARQEFRELELRDKDEEGRVFWISTSGAPIFDSHGVFKGYRGIGRNITERKEAEEKIERLAFYDVLTDLPNRRLLMDHLQYAVATCARGRLHGALLFIDLDNFKDLNDTRGHDVGDGLLRVVAQRLKACVRESDTVARFGGDEFVVLLQDLDGTLADAGVQAELVARKILQQLNIPYELPGGSHHSTPSIGVVLIHGLRQSVDELLKQADLAMYEAKSAGRNTLRFFDPAMQSMVAERTELESDLRAGLQRGELMLYYQPVVDADRRVVGAEALLRWQHPVRGMVSPMQFVPLAEQTGLIIPLGEWVLQTACAQLAAWARSPDSAHLTLAVNVSARQFRSPEFVVQVQNAIQQNGADPRLLKLELTESLLLTDSQEAIMKMTALRSLGVRFALDDFGTGYSSLSYLKMLPLQQLKIDQSFVRDVLTDVNDAAIASTVLALGRSLGFDVVAEGVETEGQRQFLLNQGCVFFQGYLFGRPVPVTEFSVG
ncbi:Cyclic di-GMP phosphodiesterase Gmr [Curvibacter sp. AEP1-3]|uniref:sensor domain-containing protein n=1 Tax=Curvibacter sp. AEP1-3 TaxID=1844971 RepID=UPI000B3CDF93|nr:EAL domain-containing protein [Curvibacter sp. AEP1-3]ARV18170.1 Cyclic di-GMP phosphodiesterase Gmr [Curvibacter sp. AEP1-3]